ncbi:MAG TPA: DUF4232 domain-containing protein [Acidimicrobiales bacterium]
MLKLRLLLTTGLLLLGSPLLTGSASATTAPLPGCAASQLELFASGWFGAGGTGAMAFEVVNRGALCRIGGYPSVTFVDASDFGIDHHDLHRASMLFSEPKSMTLNLPRSGVATFGVSWADNPVGNDICPNMARAEVVLKDGVGNLSGLVPINSAPCGGTLMVTPIESGSWPRPND